jgi:hypothetical protein
MSDGGPERPCGIHNVKYHMKICKTAHTKVKNIKKSLNYD